MLNIVIGFLCGMIGAFIYEKLPFQKVVGVKKLVIRGYKFHHSLYGIIPIISAFFFHENAILLISSGIGVIVEHYLTGGGLDFITKEK